MMKNTRYIISLILVIVGIIVAGCNKRDCNGDLDGQWQLLLWTNPDGDTLATKDSMIFYNVQLKMMRFQKLSGTPYVDMMSSFEKYPQAIRIYDPLLYKSSGHDSIYNMSVLKSVGVPEDGVMNILSLSSSEMVLSSALNGTLKFRKY